MITIRIICFMGMILAGLFSPWIIFLSLTCVYALLCTPYELLLLAVLIDAQFGDVAYGIPYQYTIGVSLVFICSIYVKPYLRFYA